MRYSNEEISAYLRSLDATPREIQDAKTLLKDFRDSLDSEPVDDGEDEVAE